MMENNNPMLAEVFGPVISCYTRAQAVVDGVQVEVSAKARLAGIRFPVFLTRAVYDAYGRNGIVAMALADFVAAEGTRRIGAAGWFRLLTSAATGEMEPPRWRKLTS